MKKRLTKGWIDGIKVDKRTRFTDTSMPILTLRVTPAGGKTFYYQARHKDRGMVERKIGTFGQWTIDQARIRAAEYAAAFNAGTDPDSAAKEERKQTVYLDEVAKGFLDQYERQVETGETRHNTWTCYERTYRLHIKPKLGAKKLRDVEPADLRDLLRLGQFGQSQHNHIIATTKGIYTYAKDGLGLDIQPPLDGIKRREQNKRERYLRPDEVGRLFDSIAQEDQIYQDTVLLLLFTGQRKSTVYTMEWAEIDMERSVWTIPGSKQKNGKPHAVPLIDDAVAILRRRKQEARTGTRYALPGKRTAHLSPKTERFWIRITKRAGLRSDDHSERLTIHDLRRTLGSWQAMEGVGLQAIAKALGHKNINVTASTYAHLDANAARGGIQTAIAAINRAAGRDSEGEASRKADAILEGLSEEEKAALIERLK
ncbi:MAG: tyrosine-type recombinase/integrase [Amphritea sp.]